MKEDDMNWPEPDFVGRKELEIVMGNERISFTTSKIGSLVDVQSSKDCMLVTNFVTCNLQAEVNVKIKKAYCPPQIVEGNPCLEYLKYIIFPWFREFEVERKVENGGNKTHKTFDDLTADYTREELHPADLKLALSKSLNRILQPVRDHFKNDPKARELLKKVKAYRITR